MPSYRDMFPECGGKFEAASHFLHLVLPSVVRPGEPFGMKAVMLDATGLPAEDYVGRVRLEASDAALQVPEELEFTPEDLGAVVRDGLVAREGGAYYVTATPAGCPGAPPRSNPVLARADGPRLYWGDIHMHTTVGNCHADTCKGPEFGYWYARHAALLDFASATDHLRGIHREPANWERIKAAARCQNAPGEFVAFLAFESSHARSCGGDNNIYYDADEAEHFWADRDDMWGISPQVGLDQLWDWLDEQGVPYVSIPHHTGRSGKYRDFELPFHNPERETVLEVYSWWGSSEARQDDLYLKGGKTDRRAYWHDALELGYRYGVIGSSDTHHTMPGTPYPVNAENYWYAQHRLNCQGLAGIYADRLERGALFDALLRRRCYATTFWRPIVEFELSGIPMGEEAAADQGLKNARTARATVVSPWPGKVELFRNNRPIARRRIEGTLTEWTVTDEEPLESVCIEGAPKSPGPFAFYYVRLEGNNGQIAWSSPVWLTL